MIFIQKFKIIAQKVQKSIKLIFNKKVSSYYSPQVILTPKGVEKLLIKI